jgi:phage terminase large subunit-like protein
MKAGPKGTLSAPPLDLRRLGGRGGDRCIRFVERYVVVPKGTGARKRLKLRPWQRAIVRGVLDEPRPRQGLVSIPAGNGKSTLAAAMGLYGLLGDRVEGAQVLVVASDERQARIIFNTARRMVELNPDLEARVHVYADRLHEPRTDSTFMALPADPGSLQGGTRRLPSSTSCTSSPTTRSRRWPPEPASASSRCCWPSQPPRRPARTTL